MTYVASNPMQNVAAELSILEALAGELEDYITGDEVYRTVQIDAGRGKRKFKMSGGDLLARLSSLQAMRESLALDVKDRLNSVITQIESTKADLKKPFHELLQRELKSRLDSLDWTGAGHEDDSESRPASQQNLLRIAAIRTELEGDIPAETAQRVEELADQLESAIEQLNRWEPRTHE